VCNMIWRASQEGRIGHQRDTVPARETNLEKPRPVELDSHRCSWLYLVDI